MSLLEVKHLKVELNTLRGMVKAVRDIDFEVEQSRYKSGSTCTTVSGRILRK